MGEFLGIDNDNDTTQKCNQAAFCVHYYPFLLVLFGRMILTMISVMIVISINMHVFKRS